MIYVLQIILGIVILVSVIGFCAVIIFGNDDYEKDDKNE